jgi:hypothetical protein
LEKLFYSVGLVEEVLSRTHKKSAVIQGFLSGAVFIGVFIKKFNAVIEANFHGH